MVHKHSLLLAMWIVMALCFEPICASAVTTATASLVRDAYPFDYTEPNPSEEVPFGAMYQWATFRVLVIQEIERYLFTVSESVQNIVGPTASLRVYNAAQGTDELYGNRLHLAQVVGRPEGNYMGMLIGATTYVWNWQQ